MKTHRRQKRSKKRVRPAIVWPVRLSPEGTKQVGVTPRIRTYVAGFKAKGKLDLVRQIVADIAKFQKVDLPLEEAKRHWAKRSANEVIRTRQIYRMDQEKAARLKKPAIMGCNNYALAVTASLRAASFTAWIARSMTHTYTKFIYKGSIWIADPLSRSRPKVRPMTEADKKLQNERISKGKHAEGASLVQIGLNDYKDFLKYY